MTLSTPAIVLRCVDFQESSRVVTLFTRETGKMAVMAKGCRNPKSPFAGYLEPGSVLDIQVSTKPGRSIQTLTQTAFKVQTWGIRTDFGRLALVMAVLELLDQSLEEDQSATELFDFAASLLGWLNSASEDVEPAYVLPYVQIRLCEFMGFRIHPNSGEARFLNIEDGDLAEGSGFGLSFKLTDDQARYVITACQHRSSALFKKSMPANELKQLIHHLDVYIQHHASDMRDRRSDALLFKSLDESDS
jgi:DNA repair protein RecO (recombination protein O)